jgi:hypothetical protein
MLLSELCFCHLGDAESESAETGITRILRLPIELRLYIYSIKRHRQLLQIEQSPSFSELHKTCTYLSSLQSYASFIRFGIVPRCKDTAPKIGRKNIPRKETARPQSHERLICSHHRSAYLAATK